MEFKINNLYYGFQLLEESKIDEIQSVARIFKHIKSGARLIHLENSDDNKLFSIGFRTTPTDSTGVAHILEHSVLCGSSKFKSKDPFGEIEKSSLNTFLNAMTYTDKTIYPVSSRNQMDYMNLMNVYLDAVLNPNIYTNHEILRQEGWRYEIDPATNKMICKGVVYSEMQGALSSPEEVICSNIYSSLFPNTTYAFVAGGDPEVIPELTQENFEQFHKKFYHPSNSYIFLYGDQDLNKCLEFIDREYLMEFDSIEIPSNIEDVEAFTSIVEQTFEYSINEEEDEKNKTFLALSFACENTTNAQEYLAMKILYNMFIKSSASPIRIALLKEGIGECMLTIDDMNMDPTKKDMFVVAVKNTEESKKHEFKNVIFDTLRNLVKNGIDKNLLEASINSIEFELREADPSRIANKGIKYNEWVLNGWVYDGDPLAHLRYEENLNNIKASINNNYFENFIEKYMIKNSHYSLVILNPKKGLEEMKTRALDEKLQNYKATLSDKELKELNVRNEKLKEGQVTVDTQEAKETVPRLPISEVCKKAEELPQEVVSVQGVTVLKHDIYTNKIAYINLLFDASVIEEKYTPYIALLGNLLGELDTKKRSYSDLITEIHKNTGGITFENEIYSEKNNAEAYHPKFIIKSKVISENIPALLQLINEIINSTVFDDTSRIKQAIQEIKSKLQMKIINAGHSVAITRVFSKFSYVNKYKDMTTGALYYQFICNLEKTFEDNIDEFRTNLKKVYETIFNKNNLLISVVGSESESNKLVSNINIILDNIKTDKLKNISASWQPSKEVEGLITASNVQFVAKGFNFAELGYKYSGKMRVMEKILTSEYLYTRVRLQGGAYGCFINMNKDGSLAFASYRDPNLTQTINTYNHAYKFLETIAFTQKDMESFIIGTVGQVYRPLTPDKKGEKAVVNYICNVSYADTQKELDEILSTTVEDVKSYAKMIKLGMDENYCCVVGNEGKIKENKDMFDKISMLL
ncbi:insulinase family protein [Clostridium sp. CS001]|uniref:insulinase family protein n=1 Tax=Clostridium sp. CS001 TaxID=2880648 RepID=UPI001CF417C4|nr:insulinase family protein [Clostridium sp. CS001]MCB2290931.1 insulinase family protein [Clostridium sp. CS001]